MTYLEIVNKILRRLREDEVTSINDTPYSKMIADLVNVVKRDVENMWNWDALRQTMTITTVVGLFNYVLAGAGNNFRILDVVNDTEDFFMRPRPTHWFDRMYLASTIQQAAPMYYNFNGVDPDGDGQLDIYPPPDGTYVIRVNAVYTERTLENDDDEIVIYPNLIIEGVIARAISERGEDGSFTEQEQRFRNMAADYIAIEASRRPEEITWQAC
jgi:hypothetical protein